MSDQVQSRATDRFAILDELVFFDHAGVAPLSGPAALALSAYAEQGRRRGYVGAGWQSGISQTKQLSARLLAAESPDEIALIPNTSTGLNLVSRGLAWRPGDNVVITNVEYPANRYPWQDLERLGVELIEVRQQPDGRIDVDDVCEAITDRTRVVAISHVQYSTGFRIDLRPISNLVHRAGGYLCVDAIQSLGAMPMDVSAQGIDFLAADGHKWLLSPEGCGIFYCRRDLIERLHPALIGWMNMQDHTNYGDYRFEFALDGRRFEPGSYNVPGALAMGASMQMLLDVGMATVWAGIESLTRRLCAGLAEIGWPVVSPRDASSERSGIVVFEPPPAAQAPEQVVARLRQRDVIVVVREGRLRASPHFYNTDAQVDRLLDALGDHD